MKAIKFKKILFSRSILGSILFAVALWIYTNMNGEYIEFVHLPLKVNLPEDLAIDKPLPSTIAVELRGTGWQLFNLNFFNTTARCYIDLSKANIDSNHYQISRNEIMKSIQFLKNVEPRDVVPQSISLVTGKIDVSKAQVIPRINVITKDGFITVGSYDIQPLYIDVKGNDNIIHNINQWPTKSVEIDNVSKPVSISVPLSDSLSSIVKLSNYFVKASIDVQMEAFLTVYDVPIRIQGGVMPDNNLIEPQTINVTLSGGINQINDFSFEEVTAYIEFKEIIMDHTGIIEPHINIPKNYRLVKSEPAYIFHYIQAQSLADFVR